jgi:NTE family protein
MAATALYVRCSSRAVSSLGMSSITSCPHASSSCHQRRSYDHHLFHGAFLQDIPDAPRFMFIATNLQTGSGWRFAKAYAADYRVGRIGRPKLSLARVVAASSAFPPFLSPVRLRFGANVVKGRVPVLLKAPA